MRHKLFEINRTILRHQARKLTEAQALLALEATSSPERVGLARARLEVACFFSDSFPMSVCEELAEALLPEERPAEPSAPASPERPRAS